VQFILYGLVGFVPAVISSWFVHRYIEEPQAAAAST
jgi:peptidoglycan/LPS O-acetylase OafA/YrhL